MLPIQILWTFGNIPSISGAKFKPTNTLIYLKADSSSYQTTQDLEKAEMMLAATHSGDTLLNNMLVQALSAAVGKSKSASFARKLTIPSGSLSLDIKGVGSLPLPVSPTRAKALIRESRKAPYGLKDKTLIDTSVRDVWEIARSRVSIDKRRWNKELIPALSTIQEKLGLPAGRLTTELHKLLIYEKGQFFLPHQDSEKSDAMLGTLIVVLPSEHKGGTLVIEHQGVTKKLQVKNPALKQLNLFAFFADCTHEIKPLTAGYRVVLAFNLNFVPAKRSSEEKNEVDSSSVQEALIKHFADKEQNKLIYLLDHQYSLKSLKWNQLKGIDSQYAHILSHAASQLGMRCHLSMVEVQQHWDAFDGNGYDRYSYYNEFDETDPSENDSDYELGELLESTTILDNWVSSENKKITYPPLGAREGEIFWSRPNESYTPTEEDFEGFMGNYGNTLDRWYHRCAVVIWPEDRHLSVLLSMGEEPFMDEVIRLHKAGAPGQASQALQQELPNWPDYPRIENQRLLKKILILLLDIRDVSVSTRILSGFNILSLQAIQIDHLVNLGEIHGSKFCSTLIAHWLGQRTNRKNHWHSNDILAWIYHLPRFCQTIQTRNATKWNAAQAQLVTIFFATMAQSHHHLLDDDLPSEIEKNGKYFADQLAAAVQAASLVREPELLAVIANHLKRSFSRYPAKTVTVFFKTMGKEKFPPEYLQLLNNVKTSAITYHSARLAKPERSKGDWSMDARSGCKCTDCSVLNKFLRSASDQSLDLPLNKNRRMHLHRTIDSLELPVNHTTLREGRPQVLQLRKKPVLGKLEKKARQESQTIISQLERLDFS